MSASTLHISPDQLCVGLYIHLDLSWWEHDFAFSHFKIKDEGQIQALRALGLKQLRYDPARSDCPPLPLPTDTPTEGRRGRLVTDDRDTHGHEFDAQGSDEEPEAGPGGTGGGA